MQMIFFSTDIDLIDEVKSRHNTYDIISCFELSSLEEMLGKNPSSIVIADYDSIAPEVNKMIASNSINEKMIVLEKAPEIATGLMLISHNIKAYGNSRISTTNFTQMIQSVQQNKVWTYPELTISLIRKNKKPSLNENAQNLLNNRLTEKEIEVVYLILDGLTNDAIATALNITTRTVKAHISSIFTKLHINDRLSLVLLLK
jgi:DNA-binding NarL/FixJ family response regulator